MFDKEPKVQLEGVECCSPCCGFKSFYHSKKEIKEKLVESSCDH